MNGVFRVCLLIHFYLSITKASEEKTIVSIDDQDKTQYHEVNLKTSAYNYGYEETRADRQFHHELRGADGVTYGCYGYVDPNKKLLVTHYVADSHGYRLIQSDRPVKIYPVNADPTSITQEDEENLLEQKAKGRLTPWGKLFMPELCRALEKEKQAGGNAVDHQILQKGSPGLPTPGIGDDSRSQLGLGGHLNVAGPHLSLGLGGSLGNAQHTQHQTVTQRPSGTGIGLGAHLGAGPIQGSLNVAAGISSSQGGSSSTSSQSSQSQSSSSQSQGYGYERPQGGSNHGGLGGSLQVAGGLGNIVEGNLNLQGQLGGHNVGQNQQGSGYGGSNQNGYGGSNENSYGGSNENGYGGGNGGGYGGPNNYPSFGQQQGGQQQGGNNQQGSGNNQQGGGNNQQGGGNRPIGGSITGSLGLGPIAGGIQATGGLGSGGNNQGQHGGSLIGGSLTAGGGVGNLVQGGLHVEGGLGHPSHKPSYGGSGGSISASGSLGSLASGGINLGIGSGSGGNGGNGGNGYRPDNSGQYVPDNSGSYNHVSGPNGPGSPPYNHVEGPSGGYGPNGGGNGNGPDGGYGPNGPNGPNGLNGPNGPNGPNGGQGGYGPPGNYGPSQQGGNQQPGGYGPDNQNPDANCNKPEHQHTTSPTRPQYTRPTTTTRKTSTYRPISTPPSKYPTTQSTRPPTQSVNTTPRPTQTYPTRPASTPNPTGSAGSNLGVQPPSTRPTTTPNPNAFQPGYQQPPFFMIPFPFPFAPTCPCYAMHPADNNNHSSQHQGQLQAQQQSQFGNQNAQLQWQSQHQFAIGFIPVLFVPHCAVGNQSHQVPGQFLQVPYPCAQCNQSNRNGRELDSNENFSSSDSFRQVLAQAGVDIFSNSLVKSPNRKRARKLKRVQAVGGPQHEQHENQQHLSQDEVA